MTCAGATSTPAALRISANAHLIMPYHMLLDHAGEIKLGKLQIGTTRRGIGPCYADKAARLGIRVQDLLDEKILRRRSSRRSSPSAFRCATSARPAAGPSDDDRGVPDLRPPIKQYIADTSRLVLERLDEDEMVVFEGAQGTLLDIDHGTYPFVTSSNPIAGSATIGAGVGPRDIDEVWGITKAYSTRVGAGRSRPSWRARLAMSCASAAPSSAPPPAARAGWVGSTWSRCATPRA